jgi:predicted kinase
VALLIHLNGPPGIGKSTLARRYVAEHPGVLNCDIDVLRTMVGGWEEDFAGAGASIRPAALAMISAYLKSSGDVVLPQMLLDPVELGRFEAAARAVGAGFVERFVTDDREAGTARFHRRGSAEQPDPWHSAVREIVAREGGDAYLARCHERLEELLAERPLAVRVPSVEGEEDATYRALVASLDRA